MKNITLREISRSNYGGGDGRAIQRHSERVYRVSDSNDVLFCLNRNLSEETPSFMLHGPYSPSLVGTLPTVKVNDKNSFGDGVSWATAEAEMERILSALFSDKLNGEKVSVSVGQPLTADEHLEAILQQQRG